MHSSRKQFGFSLFELLIAVAVIGIVSAFAVPAYRSYISTANMTKVTANFEQGIRVAQNAYAKNKTRVAVGLPGGLPNTTEDWIAVFNPNDMEAPGGGPAFIPSTNKKATGRGDPITGAIGVEWTPYQDAEVKKNGSVKAATDARLRLWRPLYTSLVEQRATIVDGEIDIKIQRKP
jgi:prepilin-type N-terminal cleavage/methylation domain-containing protein